jgi:hypothetical protein
MRYLFFSFAMLLFAFHAGAQTISISIEGGKSFVSSTHCENGYEATLYLENSFNKHLSIGLAGNLGVVDYVEEESFFPNSTFTHTEKLEVVNYIYAMQVIPKYTFVNTDYLKLAIAPRIGMYWSESRPTYWETDHTSATVRYESLETKHSGAHYSFGAALQGRYFITEKLSLQASIGWQNHDISTSVNKVDTQNYRPQPNMGKASFLNASIGIAYRLWGKSLW